MRITCGKEEKKRNIFLSSNGKRKLHENFAPDGHTREILGAAEAEIIIIIIIDS